MNNRHPGHYFASTKDFHSDLFDGLNNVWEILNRLSDYLQSLPLGQITVPIPQGVTLVNQKQITLCEGVQLEPGAYVCGPCYIGPNTLIRHGAYIRGGVLTGEHCVIGHASEVKNSLFFPHAHAAHFAYVGDSVLGEHVNLGAGVRCANLRLDEQPVSFRDEKTRAATGRRKLGAILGDNAQVGCNAVLNPGTFMGPGSSCYPLVSIGGYVKPNTCIRTGTHKKEC